MFKPNEHEILGERKRLVVAEQQRWWQSWWQARPSESDALSVYRSRIIYTLALATLIFFVPFAINNFFQGRIVIGIGTCSMVLILAVDAIAIYRKKNPPLPVQLMILPIVPTIVLAARAQGFGPILWCYPALLLFHFILARHVANALTVVLLVVLAPVSYRAAGPAVTLRLLMTLALTAVLSNILVNVISGLQERLLEQSIVDPLTGAYNRRHMESSLTDAIERNRRTGAPASVFLIDVDHFKSINDQFGHAAGDTVLKGVVALMRQRARRTDLLFRIGGEEFVLLLPDTHEEDAAVLAEDLRALIAQAPLLYHYPVSVSVGVSELRPGESLDSWLKYADEALYRAKEIGRNRVMRRIKTVAISHD